MGKLLLILRILMMPIRFLMCVIYPELRRRDIIVQYAWYSTSADYKKIIQSSKDDRDDIITEYSIWKLRAEKRLNNLSENGILYIKVIVKPNELKKWLKINNLENVAENRKRYVEKIFEDIVTNGVQHNI